MLINYSQNNFGMTKIMEKEMILMIARIQQISKQQGSTDFNCYCLIFLSLVLCAQSNTRVIMVLVIEQLCKSFVGLLLPELAAAVPRIRGICQREFTVVSSTSNLLSHALHSTLSFAPRLGILTLSTTIAMWMVNQGRLTILF